MGYDVIGDIHGQAAKLEALLAQLGYSEGPDGWVPPAGRQAVFLGDLIDRGPEQLKVIRIVRGMVDAGHARCVMGNHEFNAIGYVTPRRDGSGRFLRHHSPDKIEQHAEFLAQVGEGSELHHELIDWFKSLPPALDLGGIRVVHAWWHQPHFDLVEKSFWDGESMSEDFLHAAHDKKSPVWAAMDGLLKGLEIDLPDGHQYHDHAGVPRKNVRTAWWRPGVSKYREAAIVPSGQIDLLPDHPLPAGYLGAAPQGAPVFVGHYWFCGQPAVESGKLACLDWAAAKAGPLVAYRWDGESELSSDRLVAAWA